MSHTYRDELEAAHARIRDLEAQIALREDREARAPLMTKLRAARARLEAEERRFWGLGPNGLGVLVVVALVLGSGGVLYALLLGGLVPLAIALVVTAHVLGLIAAALRRDKRAQIGRELVRVDASIEEARVRVAEEEQLEDIEAVDEPVATRTAG
jgi:hypothetical protein